MIKFIGDVINENVTDGYYCSGIYLHGKIETLNGYDIVRTRYNEDHDFISNLKEKTIQECTVLIKGKEIKAIAYLWRTDRGLIVLEDDEKALQDAIEKYTSEKNFI